MKSKLIAPAVLATSLATLAATAQADFSEVPDGAYAVDPTHGYILFSYTHLGLSNPSVGFNDFDAVLNLDADAPENSTITVTIDAASVDSRVAEFDEHLNSPEWLDTARYPEITFRSTGIEPLGEDRYALTGDLTVKGITRPVTLDATINAATMHPMRNVPVVGVSASGTVLRSDYGLEKYAPAVTDELTLNIQVEMLKSE
jgi:polyisoprenoid-binding protein YceI